LIASRYYNKENNYEKLGEYLGADSLAYLSREGMLEAFGHDKSEMCMACLDGDYPIPISAQTRLGLGKFMLEKDESGNGKASDSDTESKIIKT
jgi:glutamine phosphoribosylpyrophosphate amidotransferase